MTMLSFLDKHIRADVTVLFRELERQPAHTSLYVKAKRLSAPFIDYEAAARAAGWVKQPAGPWRRKAKEQEKIYDNFKTLPFIVKGSAQEACEFDGITPHEIPIIGHYIVTAELADKLEARGKRVERDFGGNIVWARKGIFAFPVDCDPVLVSIFEEGGL